MRYFLAGTSVLLVFLSFPVAAQRIENVKAMVIGEKIIITYDISGASDGQKFKLQLFGSHNNFNTSLSLVKGDVGSDNLVTAGTNRRIEWEAKNELKDFDGEITFEVRGEVIAAPYSMLGPVVDSKFRRGKKMDIKWKGGRAGESVKLELLKGGVSTMQIAETSNTGNYSWSIPKSTAKGNDYTVRLTADGRTATTNPFTVKGKSPFIWIALPVVVVGGVLYFVTQSGGKEKDNSLPLPIEPN